MIAPVLSPQVVDSHHPFPHLEGKVLYIAALLSHKKTERLGLIPAPASLPPLIFLPNDKRRCLMTEDIILAFADDVFEMYDVLEKTVFCVTRNADVPLDDEPFGSEQVDLRRKMEKMLRQRRRMGRRPRGTEPPGVLALQGVFPRPLRGHGRADLPVAQRAAAHGLRLFARRLPEPRPPLAPVRPAVYAAAACHAARRTEPAQSRASARCAALLPV